jgi:hypothetical protein
MVNKTQKCIITPTANLLNEVTGRLGQRRKNNIKINILEIVLE